jgi:hypothetical protein
VWAAAVGLAFVVATTDRSNQGRCLALVAVAAGSAGLTLAWPFYRVTELPGASGGIEASNAAVFTKVVPRTFLALPGVLAIALRLREHRRDPVVLGFAAAGGLFAIGWALDRPTLGRALPAVMLMRHVAMADLVARVLGDAGGGRRRSAAIVAVAVIVAVGVATTAAGTIRAVPRTLLPDGLANRPELASLVDPYRPLGDRIARDDVTAASERLALPSAAVSGKVIAPFVGSTFVDDLAERKRTSNAILDPDTTSGERERLIRRYGVDWLVLTPGDAERLRRADVFADRSFVLDTESQSYVLVRVVEP